MKTIVRILFIPFVIITFIGFFSIIDPFLAFTRYKDVITNIKFYNKKIVEVDSLYYSFADDVDNGSYYGYSKYLDNYKTTIYFGKDVTGYKDRSWYERSKVKNDSLNKDDYNDTKYHYIWYRPGYPKAFPASETESVFPVKSRLFEELRIFIIWVISTLCTIIIWKTGVKMGMLDKKNEDEK